MLCASRSEINTKGKVRADIELSAESSPESSLEEMDFAVGDSDESEDLDLDWLYQTEVNCSIPEDPAFNAIKGSHTSTTSDPANVAIHAVEAGNSAKLAKELRDTAEVPKTIAVPTDTAETLTHVGSVEPKVLPGMPLNSPSEEIKQEVKAELGLDF
ncbi:hypothetical protein BYT27DRAFT_7264356 [Phlegmacium glaucopus]|nr:hypothetical protein BYT27DRAFT_7264356 [Phlegmacium glaucopus]